MPTIKLRGEGWLALPAEFRRKLKLQSGDELEAEIVDDAIRLRVVGRVQSSLWPQETEALTEAAPAPAAASPAAVETSASSIPAPTAAAPEPEVPAVAPKRQGRPPKAKSTAAPQAEEPRGAETEMMVEAGIPAPAIVVPDPEPPSPQPKRRGRPPKVRQET